MTSRKLGKDYFHRPKTTRDMPFYPFAIKDKKGFSTSWPHFDTLKPSWYWGQNPEGWIICHPPAISTVFSFHRILWSISMRSISNIKSPYFDKIYQNTLSETLMQSLWNWPLLLCFCLCANILINISSKLLSISINFRWLRVKHLKWIFVTFLNEKALSLILQYEVLRYWWQRFSFYIFIADKI